MEHSQENELHSPVLLYVRNGNSGKNVILIVLKNGKVDLYEPVELHRPVVWMLQDEEGDLVGRPHFVSTRLVIALGSRPNNRATLNKKFGISNLGIDSSGI
jgi:hypothetical protein